MNAKINGVGMNICLNLSEENDWQPIETAPKDGTRIRIKSTNGHVGDANWQTTYGGEWHVKSFKHLPWHEQKEITLWRPIATDLEDSP